MNTVEITICVLIFATLGVSLTRKLHVPLEVLLLLGSLLLSFVPHLPHLDLNPELIFEVFLPPILFGAAYFTSWHDLKFNMRPIALLAIGLVLCTTFSLGFLLHWLIPGLPLTQALLLGAIVSPPDASAASALIRNFPIPRRLVAVLEGESLVNDATALVCYRFALAAVATGEFSAGRAVTSFFWIASGGIIFGLAIGFGAYAILLRLRDSRAETLWSLLTAFACFLGAEHLGFSGVLATVAGGLYFGRMLPSSGAASAKTRIESRASWELVLFVINGLIFTLIGLQLPTILSNLSGGITATLLGYAAVTVAVVMGVRILWVFPATYLPRYLISSVAKRDPSPPWRVVVLLSWTGMRGIVSLAAALAIPITLENGAPFPNRDLLIFLTYSVVLATLLIPAATLPLMIRFFGLKDDGGPQREEAKARVRSTEAVVEHFRKRQVPTPMKPHLIQLQERYERRLKTVRSNLDPTPFSSLIDDDQQLRRLTHEALALERKSLNEMRQKGEVHDEIFHALVQELDLEEMRLKTSPRL
ncbi:MAG: Na+/H+ antiporter [Bacteriovoracia bacterium]